MHIATDIAVGGYSACVSVVFGAGVQCWGENDRGQLGTGSFSPSSTTPVSVNGLGDTVHALSTGDDASCAVLSSAIVQCWGANSVGALGIGAVGPDSASPVTAGGV